MSATVFYDNVNEIALLTNTFLNSSGVPADPTSVSCIITDPAAASTTHTYLGSAPADIVKPLVGKYTLSVPCSPSVSGIDGLWSFEWIGTGAVSDVQPGTWRVLAPDLATWYVGPEELKSRLGITDTKDDYEIALACRAASRYVERYCGRHFYRVTDTRTYQPTDIWMLRTDDLVSTSAVNIDYQGNGTYDTSWVLNVDYMLRVGDDEFNQLGLGEARPFTQIQTLGQGGRWFPFVWPYAHLNRVQIVGVFGWPAVPHLVNQAALMIASDLFKNKDTPFGVLGMADIGVIRVGGSQPWIFELLRPYVRPRKKVGV